MSRMSELDAEIKEMTMAELETAFRALRACESKGVRDEFMQELYAQELDRRQRLWMEVTV
jgi:hypothetical protein